MTTTTMVITHERLGGWARQIRPRLASSARDNAPARLVETRSTHDLLAAVAGRSHPLILLDVADRPRAALEDLDEARQAAPGALILVLDPAGHPGLATLGLELGATAVLSGVAPPPSVWSILARWTALARRRIDRAGWSPPEVLPTEPWERHASIPPRRLS